MARRTRQEKADQEFDGQKGDCRSYTMHVDPVTGDPFLVAGPRTPQQIEDDRVMDAIWQKLLDKPSLDPEMHGLMFGAEEEMTEEQIEEEERKSIPWEQAKAESDHRLAVMTAESRRRLRTGEPRLSSAEAKAIFGGDFISAAKLANCGPVAKAIFEGRESDPFAWNPDAENA